MKKEETLTNWQEIQDRFADESGLAVVLVDENSAEISLSNNNSICRFLYNSKEFAPRCAEFCGKAFETARAAGKPVHVKCHAALNFLTVPLETESEKRAAIVGRTFLKSEDFRAATERAAEGDWAQFPVEEFFANVLLSGSLADVENAAKKFGELFEKEAARFAAEFQTQSDAENSEEEKRRKAEGEKEKSEIRNLESEITADRKPQTADRINLDDWRSKFGSLLESDYKTACDLILQFVAERFGFANSAWLERRDDELATVTARGKFENEAIQIRLSADDELLLDVLRRQNGLEMRERASDETVEPQTIWLFPVAVGGAIRGALFVGNGSATDEAKKRLARFCRKIAPQIEILRLRRELERQTILSDAIKKFNENLDKIEPENLWEYLADFCAELMRSERSSLLLFDEDARQFTVKTAIGRRAEIVKNETESLGKRVAESVFESGKPLVVRDLAEANIAPAPAEWKYKSASFISFPIIVGERKIGVLNVTDRAGGKIFDEFDLELLDSIAPQFAVALDRANFKNKAGEYEQLSVTDALTGLSNRRYLEARLEEEIKRSHRTGAPMSFMMIDVDEFKPYNDAFGHTEGDRALQIVAKCLRETLRGADVAARYGGEEFSILLPQTTINEAYLTAERVRRKIEQTEFPNRKVTVSIGVAACPPKCTLTGLVSSADKALYEAKRGGRNRVRIFEEEKTEA
jgi:diguanylate cyclase (GGDEF)-like protein